MQEAGVPQTLEDTAKKLLEEDRPQLAEEYVQLWAIFCGVLDQFESRRAANNARKRRNSHW